MLYPKQIFFGVLFVFLLVNIPTFGQTKPFQTKHYTIQDGLPGRLVLDVFVDDSGLIWLTTENGLARFDGYEFIPFPNFSYSLDIAGSEFWMEMTPNSTGALTIAHGNKDLSFDLFDLATLKSSQPDFAPFPNPPLAIYTKINGSSYFAFKHHQKLHICRLGGGHELETLFSVDLLNLETNQSINLFVDKQNNFWIEQNKEILQIFSEQGKLLKHYTAEDFSPNSFSLETVFIFQDQQDRIWLTLKNEKGVFLYDQQNQSFERKKLSEKSAYFSDVWEDTKGNLLFKGSPHTKNAYLKDLVCLEPSGQLTSFDYLNFSLRSFSDIHAKDFFESMVVGAPTGLIIIDQRPSAFNQLLDKKITTGEWGTSVRGITGDTKGNIFIGTETNQLYQYNCEKDTLLQLPLYNKYAIENRRYFGGRNIFLDKNNQIWSLSHDSDSESYFHKFDLESNQTSSLKFNGLTNNFTFDGNRYFYFITIDKKNEDARFIEYDIEKKFFSDWLDREGKNPVLGQTSRSIVDIQDGILWIGTTNGLIKINLIERTSEKVLLKDNKGVPLPNQEILAITHAINGLWLGTNRGFLFYNTNDRKIEETYGTDDGLVSNNVCGILLDEQDNLWLSTFNGLSYFDRAQNRFYNFYESDGLSHNEFNRMAFHQDQNKQYYFGGMNGVNMFDAEKLLHTRAEKQIVLTKFLQSYVGEASDTIQIANLKNLDEVILEPDYTHFEFNFSMPDYLSNEIRYFAWLENYEKDWNYLGNSPRVRYNKIPAGKYSLQLKAIDAKGNPSKNVINIPITVNEVFYKQTWFQMLVGTILALILWAISLYHTNQRLKLERLRTKLSSDLHDEVSGLLAGIAMQTDMMQMTINNEVLQEKLAKIGATSRSAMSKMGDVVWSIDARKDKLSDLLNRMQEHTAEILQPLGINYQFDINNLNIDKKIGLKLRQNLYLIFKEVINNIAKHSTASKAEIGIKNKGNVFYLRVKDNGSPKEKTKAYKTGQGLSNLKMRSEEINGELSIFSKDGYEVILKVKRFA